MTTAYDAAREALNRCLTEIDNRMAPGSRLLEKLPTKMMRELCRQAEELCDLLEQAAERVARNELT